MLFRAKAHKIPMQYNNIEIIFTPLSDNILILGAVYAIIKVNAIERAIVKYISSKYFSLGTMFNNAITNLLLI